MQELVFSALEEAEIKWKPLAKKLSSENNAAINGKELFISIVYLSSI